MIFLDPREPVSAWSHAFGLLLALAVTWVFWLRCKERLRGAGAATACRRPGHASRRAKPSPC